SWRETARVLGLRVDPDDPGKWVRTGKGILATWGGRPIQDITRKNVIAYIDDMARDAPISANRTLATIRKMFNWCISRDAIEASPCAGVEPPGDERSRDRILTDDEIVRLLKVCDDIGQPYGPFVQALLLSGQRLREVSGITRAEIDDDNNWN